MKILSVFRSSIRENRGTPLRVRSLIRDGMKHSEFTWSTASVDSEAPFEIPHIELTHDHYRDISKIISYVRKEKIDMVIFHSVAAAFYLPFIKYGTHALMVLEMHGFREEEELLYGYISRPWYYVCRFRNNFLYRMADLITTSGQTTTDYLKRFNQQCVTVYGGVDLELFNPKVPSGGYIEKRLGTITVGYAGDHRKWQGLPFLFDAFEKLHEKYPEFRLEILSSEKKKLPERPYIHVLRALPHEKVASLTIDCDILVIPRTISRVNELAYPSKFMEYMAMGKCVVVSRTSDMHRIIQDGENGLLFDPENVDGFLRAMERARDPELRKYLGERAYKTAKEGYTWDIQGQVFRDALHRLVDGA